jgi:hypothetical protein
MHYSLKKLLDNPIEKPFLGRKLCQRKEEGPVGLSPTFFLEGKTLTKKKFSFASVSFPKRKAVLNPRPLACFLPFFRPRLFVRRVVGGKCSIQAELRALALMKKPIIFKI